VYIEAGVLLDLLESLASHLPTLDVRNQRRLAAAKYNLLSTKVDVKDKKRVCELALRALESGLCFHHHLAFITCEYSLMILNQRHRQSLGGQHGKDVDGLFDKASFQTAFKGVESLDIKRYSIPDCGAKQLNDLLPNSLEKCGIVKHTAL